MPLALEKLVMHAEELMKSTPETMCDLIAKFSKYDAEITVPVISYLLEEKLRPLYGEGASLNAINTAIEVFRKADYYQCLNFLTLATKLSDVKELLKTGLDNLISQIPAIDFKKEDEVLWRCLYICLESLYKRVFDLTKKDLSGQPRKEKDGSFERIDQADRIFFKVIGLSKFNIALYYHHTAEIILEKLKKLNEAPKPLEPAFVALASLKTLEETEEGILFQVNVPRPLADRFRFFCSEFIKNPDSVTVDGRKRTGDAALHDSWRELEKVADANEASNKIEKLHVLYLEHGLTDDLRAVLSTLKDGIESCCMSYMNSYNTYYSYMPIFYTKAHASIATDLIAEARSAEATPDKLLTLLFSARKQLMGDNSIGFLPKINTVLLSAYQNILTRLQHLQPKPSMVMQ